MNTGNRLLDAALTYAERGWRVIPLHSPAANGCSCGDPSCSSVGKHPRTRKGLDQATDNSAIIRGWWERWPDANIGVLTGRESGVVVLDVDDKGTQKGHDSLAALTADGNTLPATYTVRTGNGKHYYFAHPGMPINNSVQKLGAGLDIRGERAYVVASPSRHANGCTYEVETDAEPAMLPDWIGGCAMDRNRNGKNMTEDEYLDGVPAVYEGTRNDTLHKLACALRGQHGMEHEQIEAVLLQYNETKCSPPLEHDEVVRIVESACKFPAEFKVKKSAKRQEESPLYWFKFNLRDFFSDENLNIMSDYQTGWYIRLKAFAWKRGGFLPADMNTLFRLAKAKSRKAFERDCNLVLSEFEPVTVEGTPMLKHPKMAATFSETLSEWMKKKEAGQASQAARMLMKTPSQPASNHIH